MRLDPAARYVVLSVAITLGVTLPVAATDVETDGL